MVMRPVAAKFFHAENRQADMAKLKVSFRNFKNAPKSYVNVYA
jgi:hypothetical protein